jgi:hypothetical protein
MFLFRYLLICSSERKIQRKRKIEKKSVILKGCVRDYPTAA